MSIKVCYFASLKESLGRSEDELAFTPLMSINDIWMQLHQGEKKPNHILVAVNMEYVGFDYVVKDNDEVAFFPPVTGG